MSAHPQPSRRAAIARSIAIDGAVILGAALLAAGAGLVYLPAGLMVGGTLLLALGLAGARR